MGIFKAIGKIALQYGGTFFVGLDINMYLWTQSLTKAYKSKTLIWIVMYLLDVSKAQHT